MSSYDDEAIEVARDLIRLDTTNHSSSTAGSLPRALARWLLGQ